VLIRARARSRTRSIRCAHSRSVTRANTRVFCVRAQNSVTCMDIAQGQRGGNVQVRPDLIGRMLMRVVLQAFSTSGVDG
jgi:hypothetical protein